jgi:hypothetical protein
MANLSATSDSFFCKKQQEYLLTTKNMITFAVQFV